MNRTEWLKSRQQGIGASDAPSILGVGFNSAADVYRSKVEPVSERPPAGFLRRGLDLEDIVAGMYSEIMGHETAKPSEMIRRHAERPWQLASIDRFRDDDTPVELKTTAGYGDEWGPTGTDQVPEGYRVQCLHQMGVLGVESCDLIALDVIAWEPRVYRILFDREAWERLTAIEARFWEHVERRQPLPNDWDDQITPIAMRVTVRGKQINFSEDVRVLIERRKELGSIRDEADSEYKRLSNILNDELGDAEIGLADGWKVKRVHVSAHRVEAFDRKATSYVKATPIKERLTR